MAEVLSEPGWLEAINERLVDMRLPFSSLDIYIDASPNQSRCLLTKRFYRPSHPLSMDGASHLGQLMS